jgi:hypothetical protein
VDISLVVLRSRLQEFMRSTDSGWSYFQKRLDTFPLEADA